MCGCSLTSRHLSIRMVAYISLASKQVSQQQQKAIIITASAGLRTDWLLERQCSLETESFVSLILWPNTRDKSIFHALRNHESPDGKMRKLINLPEMCMTPCNQNSKQFIPFNLSWNWSYLKSNCPFPGDTKIKFNSAHFYHLVVIALSRNATLFARCIALPS